MNLKFRASTLIETIIASILIITVFMISVFIVSSLLTTSKGNFKDKVSIPEILECRDTAKLVNEFQLVGLKVNFEEKLYLGQKVYQITLKDTLNTKMSYYISDLHKRKE